MLFLLQSLSFYPCDQTFTFVSVPHTSGLKTSALRCPVSVCTALVVTTKLIGPDLINAVYPMVVERLRHPKEHVRKKVCTFDLPFFALAPSLFPRP